MINRVVWQLRNRDQEGISRTFFCLDKAFFFCSVSNYNAIMTSMNSTYFRKANFLPKLTISRKFAIWIKWFFFSSSIRKNKEGSVGNTIFLNSLRTTYTGIIRWQWWPNDMTHKKAFTQCSTTTFDKVLFFI